MADHSLDQPKIVCAGLTKRFGGTVALDRVDLKVQPGRVHAIVGENGAGKSTLGKVLAGVHQPDDGVLAVDGLIVTLRSPLDALNRSITMVAQELSLLDDRSVVDNVFLGIEAERRGLLKPSQDLKRFTELADEHGFDVDPQALVRDLSVAEQQKVEILRALARDAQIIVMDEPTARFPQTKHRR